MTILNCAAVEQQLPDYLEGTAADELRNAVEQHAATCLACRSLLSDLRSIQARAGALAELRPTRDLWVGINARISPAPVAVTSTARRWTQSPPWLAFAASLLIMCTAGVTWLVARRGEPPVPRAMRVAVTAPVGQTPANTPEAAIPAQSGSPAVDTPARTQREPTVQVADGPARPWRGNRPRGGSGAALASRDAAAPTPADAVYAEEITALQRIVQEKRPELNPETIRIVEENLRVIDAAVAASRRALRSDPASAFLAEQLNVALERKVELLRSIAVMPSGT